jgi:ribosome-associated protein
MHDNNTLLNKLVSALEDIQAIDIEAIDVQNQTAITDYMIVCSGRSSRHVRAIAETMMVTMKEAGLPALHHTGLDSGEWALVDFSDFVLHVMQPTARSFYNLEGLWQASH